MNTFPLGPVDVNRIGFGAMQLPGPGVFGPPRNHEEAIAVLRRAVELGANHIDTAQFYGPEVANELIREALHPYPDDLLLVSKVGATRDDKGAWLPAQRPEQLRSAVEDNLRTLHVDQLGVVNLRLHAEHDSAPDQRVSLEDQLSEMVSLRMWSGFIVNAYGTFTPVTRLLIDEVDRRWRPSAMIRLGSRLSLVLL